MSQPTTPILTITSQDDAIVLVLTQSSVIMRISEKILNQVHEEIQANTDIQQPGLLGRFARFVANSAEKMVSHAIEYAITDIKNMEYTGGKLAFTYAKKHALSFESITVGDHGQNVSALALFAPEDAQAFVEQFQRVKAMATL